MLLKQGPDAICQNHSGKPVTLFCRLKPATPIDDHGVSSPRRRRWTVIAAMVLGSCLASAPAFAETRSLKLHHLHTQEKAEIVYKRNGRYDAAGLKKINNLLRDWRRNEPTGWTRACSTWCGQAHRQSGSNGYIQIVSGYRAPATNAMLRGRSKGVAKNSQHMLGKAMDFYIPGVPLKKLRDIGLKLQGGGVGYYPTSGSPFVHMDVGNVRHWPGINRQELARLFPEGKTLHVPSDGKPLPGYGQALAAYQARKASGTPNIEMASAAGGKRGAGNLLAALFGGGGADEADDMADAAPRAKAAKPIEPPKAEAPKTEVPQGRNARHRHRRARTRATCRHCKSGTRRRRDANAANHGRRACSGPDTGAGLCRAFGGGARYGQPVRRSDPGLATGSRAAGHAASARNARNARNSSRRSRPCRTSRRAAPRTAAPVRKPTA